MSLINHRVIACIFSATFSMALSAVEESNDFIEEPATFSMALSAAEESDDFIEEPDTFEMALNAAAELDDFIEEPSTLVALSATAESGDLIKERAPAVETPLQRCNLSTHGKGRFSIMGEFLYWKPLEGGTEFAFPTRTTAPIPGKTSPSSIPFRWEPGYRVGAKYYPSHNGWNLSFAAANLRSSVSDRLAGVLFPLQASQSSIQDPTASFTSARSASAHWHLNYWVFDLRLGCEMSVCDHFLFNPYAGLKGALIHQSFLYNYGGVAEGAPPTRNYAISNKNHCDTIGPQGGMHGEWLLGKGFRLIGDGSAALVYGWFHVRQEQSGQTGLSDVIDFSSDFQRVLPTVDLLLALSWGAFFHNHSMHFELHAGYQAQYWWRQNQTPRFTDSSSPYYAPSSEDLGLQGLVAGGSFDF